MGLAVWNRVDRQPQCLTLVDGVRALGFVTADLGTCEEWIFKIHGLARLDRGHQRNT